MRYRCVSCRSRPERTAALTGPRALDHIVIATPDLTSTVEAFADLTGVCPSFGGNHEGLGSRNYLVRLTGSSYLEIIGRNPDVAVPDDVLPFRIGRLDAPRIATWALHPADLAASLTAARGAGLDLGAPAVMSRRRPDGVVLQWQLTGPYAEETGIVPFLIDWSGSPEHPAASTLPQVDLLRFHASHPEPELLAPVLGALGVDDFVEEGPAGFALSLRTPKGEVHLYDETLTVRPPD